MSGAWLRIAAFHQVARITDRHAPNRMTPTRLTDHKGIAGGKGVANGSSILYLPPNHRAIHRGKVTPWWASLSRGLDKNTMKTEKFIERLMTDVKRRPGVHYLEPPLTDKELQGWCRANKDVNLPGDYLALLRIANGFRLGIAEDDPKGAFQLLPLREVRFAARIMYLDNKSVDDDLPATWFGIADDPLGARFLILDVGNGRYLEVDPIDPQDPEVVGKDIGRALKWITRILDDG